VDNPTILFTICEYVQINGINIFYLTFYILFIAKNKKGKAQSVIPGPHCTKPIKNTGLSHMWPAKSPMASFGSLEGNEMNKS
jgi:hypothetical protein